MNMDEEEDHYKPTVTFEECIAGSVCIGYPATLFGLRGHPNQANGNLDGKGWVRTSRVTGFSVNDGVVTNIETWNTHYVRVQSKGKGASSNA